MIIEKIKIYNFGPFYKEHEITLDGNGVNLIRGNNGQGKTSVLKALLWCLYGHVKDKNAKEIPPTSLLNNIAKDDDIYQFYVRIIFSHEDVQWTIFRKMSANKHSDSKYKEGMSLDVTKDGAVEPNPQQVIERIIPEGVSRYFFFDGEMLKDYEVLLDESNLGVSILRDAIERILGVHYFVTARDDILAVKRKVESDRTKLVRKLGGQDYDEVGKDLQDINEEIEVREVEIKQLGTDIDDLKVNTMRKMKEQAELKEVKELGDRRIKLGQEQEDLDRKKEKILVEMHGLTKNLYKSILSDAAKSLVKQFDLKQKKSSEKYAEKLELIGKVKGIKAGINASQCKYCGSVLNKDKLDELQKELEITQERINELTQVPEPNHEFEDSKIILDKMLKEYIDRDSFKELQKNISDIDHKYAIIQGEIDQISEKLGKNPQDKRARELEIEIQGMKIEQARMEQKQEDLRDVLAERYDIKNELDRLINSISRAEIDELNTRIKCLELISRVFDTAISDYRDEKRLEVESNATAIFRKIRSKDYFEKLKINDQYGLSIITHNNRILDKSEWHSSGEEQLVALSLIGALNMCAQIKAPVIMDTPFGRLDTIHGEKVLNYLPDLSEQVVLLVTDREFRKGDEKYLSGKIKCDYTLENRGEDEGSFIIVTRGSEE